MQEVRVDFTSETNGGFNVSCGTRISRSPVLSTRAAMILGNTSQSCQRRSGRVWSSICFAQAPAHLRSCLCPRPSTRHHWNLLKIACLLHAKQLPVCGDSACVSDTRTASKSHISIECFACLLQEVTLAVPLEMFNLGRFPLCFRSPVVVHVAYRELRRACIV